MNEVKIEQEILRKLQNSWKTYKGSTNTSQAKTAKALGMNQSAFSQYLRGEIGVNTDFIAKFEALTGEKISDGRKAVLRSMSLDITFSLSGLTPLVKRVLVDSMVTSADCFGVLVDMPSPFDRGSIIVADPSSEIRDKDLVVLLSGEKAVLGNIAKSEDGWSIAIPSWGEVSKSHLDKDSVVARVVSSYYPQKAGKVVKLT